MGDNRTFAYRYSIRMETVQQAAERLIQEHGENAAGEAFERALEARVSGRQDEAERWLQIAVEVMRQDRLGQRVEFQVQSKANG